jgi:structural maintenance of chromosomes protein 6
MSFKRAFPHDLLPCFYFSGGERSYTTMALLVAMGETLETPFRILDEFDVFLDAETRKFSSMCSLDELDVFLDAFHHCTLQTPGHISSLTYPFRRYDSGKLVISFLIHVATTLKHRQFIFITPQDLSSVQANDQVKILKLNPPDRHQNAGGPTQQTLTFASQS